MSRATGAPLWAALFDRLVDDAAVYPPGLAPLDVAVTEHRKLQAGPYAAGIGPLLVPATSAGELAGIVARWPLAADGSEPEPIRVGLVVRPDGDHHALLDGAELLRDEPRAEVVGAEVGWAPGWRQALDLGVPIAVEVGRGREQEEALDDVAAAVDDDAAVRVKFRTGRSPGWAWPDEEGLGRFLDATVLRGLSFKLTGGLHHAVRAEHGSPDAPDPMHGVLNVLLATHAALDGAEAPELAEILAVTDAEQVTSRVSALTPVQSARVRTSLTSYGCCGVTDPLTELEALGLFVPESA